MSDPTFSSITGPALEGTSARWGNGYILPAHAGIGRNLGGRTDHGDDQKNLFMGYGPMAASVEKWRLGGSIATGSGTLTARAQVTRTRDDAESEVLWSEDSITQSGSSRIEEDEDGNLVSVSDFEVKREIRDHQGYESVSVYNGRNEMDGLQAIYMENPDDSGSDRYPRHEPAPWVEDGELARVRERAIFIESDSEEKTSIGYRGVGAYYEYDAYNELFKTRTEEVRSLNGEINLEVTGPLIPARGLITTNSTLRYYTEYALSNTSFRWWSRAIRVMRVSSALYCRPLVNSSANIPTSRVTARLILCRRRNGHAYYRRHPYWGYRLGPSSVLRAHVESESDNSNQIDYSLPTPGFRDHWGSVPSSGWANIPWYYSPRSLSLVATGPMVAVRWRVYCPSGESGSAVVRLSSGENRTISVVNGRSAVYSDSREGSLVVQIVSVSGLPSDNTFLGSQSRIGYPAPYQDDNDTRYAKRVETSKTEYKVTSIEKRTPNAPDLPDWPYPPVYYKHELKTTRNAIWKETYSVWNNNSGPPLVVSEVDDKYLYNDIDGSPVESTHSPRPFGSGDLGFLEQHAVPDSRGEILETEIVNVASWERPSSGANLMAAKGSVVIKDPPEDGSSWFLEDVQVFVSP